MTSGKKIMSWIKTETGKNISVLVFSALISLLFLELFLRFYNPFGFRIKGDKILLYPHKKYVIENSSLKGTDKKIIHSKNSLGLRGEEPPKDFSSRLSVIAVGGSTTEGFYLSDGKTWPEILQNKLKKDFPNIWINNAGIDGQSSYGHIIFTREYLSKLKPKIAIFYCGLNDIGLSAMNSYDSFSKESKIKKAAKFLSKNIEIVSCAFNLYLYFSYKKTGITHGNIDFANIEKIKVSDQEKKEILNSEKQNAKNYSLRLKELIRETRKNGIEPVFIAQTSLCKKAFDLNTKINLGEIAVKNKFLNCEIFGEILNIYNREMEKTAKEEKVFFIDADKIMPSNSSYYYDLFHFNNSGAEVFADKIKTPFIKFLKNKYNN